MDNNKNIGRLKKKSSFDPVIKIAAMETFEQTVTSEVLKEWDQVTTKNKMKKKNITNQELKALKELSRDEELIIKKADKGGATVLMDNKDYVQEALNQLQDEAVYKKLDQDPTNTIKQEIDMVLNESYEQGLITAEIKRLLTNDAPRVPLLYLVPKIHKGLDKPPGRPIVSGVDS